jgi:hypothetical protein
MQTTTTHIIRVTKAAQTQAHTQRLALLAIITNPTDADDIDAPFLEEVADAVKTAEDHINALQHIIDKLTA